MARLFFRYGAMGSSKTANALMTRYNFIEKGKKVLLIKPDAETRDEKTKIRSRIGLEAECILWSEFKQYDYNSIKELDAIIVDEVQFLSENEIEELKTVCWCGNSANMNARIDEDGKVIREGQQILMGANDKYISLCRKHYREGKIRQ